jgi:ATP-dependent RNA helicase SUPV3L1/SUV3
LSDALHGALTQRFVDRRTSVLMRRLKQKEAMVAEVNEQGVVSVEDEFVGRLEGFRFIRDKAAAGQEARTLQQASLAALGPHFHLKADQFYNAPDTMIDFTEQGGMMWGTEAVGKLTAGSDPLRPQAVAFVDDEAGPDVAAKVQRRLQHFIDRKIATLFEPLMAMSRDEALTGLARGFGFRLVEAMGVLPRGEVADEVKALDQEARGALRKHGVRFGQFTVFLPALLKPAPTRLRLVLWSLARGLDTFPEAPPPGLVTVPADADAQPGYFAMAGYRAAGERAIRIDMLERLADMLRSADTRGGFEATADMLSITGMTLEQFAGLMQGLGYRAEKAEREKVKPVDQALAEAPADAAQAAGEPPAETAEEAVEAIADEGEAPIAATPPQAEGEVTPEISKTPEEEVAPGETPEMAEPEIEVYYTFTWAPRANRPAQGGRGKPQGKAQGKPKGKGGPKGKPREDSPRNFSSKPDKKDRIDPDNPFAAALMGLKDKN